MAQETGLFDELRKRLPATRFETIFDVGANVGQSTSKFRAEFPEAQVWAFEPVLASFEAFQARHGTDSMVHAAQVALGDAPGTALISAHGTATGNKILAAARAGEPSHSVEVTTGDDVMRIRGIQHVDYLKIDVEGHEFRVLDGFASALARHAIDLVQIETGLNPRNRVHVPFEGVKSRMEAQGYFLFGFLNVAYEFGGLPMLRRFDCVFVSDAAVQKNKAAT